MCRADGTELAQAAAEARPPAVKQPPVCPRRLILFNFNLILGLLISQLIPEWLEGETYQRYQHAIRVITMFHLSYIMMCASTLEPTLAATGVALTASRALVARNVGFEFDIDKRNKRKYAVDYAVSCAGCCWTRGLWAHERRRMHARAAPVRSKRHWRMLLTI